MPAVPPPVVVPPVSLNRSRRGLAYAAGAAGLLVALAVTFIVIRPKPAPRPKPDPIPTASTTKTTATRDPVTVSSAPPTTPVRLAFPPPPDVKPWSIGDAQALLTAAGLLVTQNVGPCSESTKPGDVRRVTRGEAFESNVIYGKSTDTIASADLAALRAGDRVTIWTPSKQPCS